jgi:hypothetical protein
MSATIEEAAAIAAALATLVQLEDDDDASGRSGSGRPWSTVYRPLHWARLETPRTWAGFARLEALQLDV